MKRYSATIPMSFGLEAAMNVSFVEDNEDGDVVPYETAQKLAMVCELYREALNVEGMLLRGKTATEIIHFTAEKERLVMQAEQLYKEVMEG